MTNPPCYTPKCASCPVKDSCNSYVKPVTHIPMIKAPYGDFPLWDSTTWSDDTTSSIMKLVVH